MIYAWAALLLTGKLTNALTPDQVGHSPSCCCVPGLAILANLGLPASLPKILQALEANPRRDTLSSLFSFQAWAAMQLPRMAPPCWPALAAIGRGVAALPPHLVLLLPPARHRRSARFPTRLRAEHATRTAPGRSC